MAVQAVRQINALQILGHGRRINVERRPMGTTMSHPRQEKPLQADAPQAAASYHHGELPETLMRLAIDHIERDGTEKLSLRALAREAGVSPTAPYRHFPSKQCLLAAIATQGFHTLSAAHAEIAARQLPVEERAVAMACAYVEFALANPVSYQLMFGTLLGDFSEFDMLYNAVNESYREVDRLLEDIVAAKQLEVDVNLLGGMLWSNVHGISSLLIGQVPQYDDVSKPMQARHALANDYEGAIRLMFKSLFDLRS